MSFKGIGKSISGKRGGKKGTAKNTLEELEGWRKKHTQDIKKPKRNKSNNAKIKESLDSKESKTPLYAEKASKSIKLHGLDLIEQYKKTINEGGTIIKAAIDCGWDYKNELGWFKQELSRAQINLSQEQNNIKNYKEWLSQTKLSESTQHKYISAIEGKISSVCINERLTKFKITAITSIEELNNLRECIEGTEAYIELDKKGNNMYKRALDYYSDFLSGKDSSSEVRPDSSEQEYGILTTEAKSVIKSRIGQGNYRLQLEEYWSNKCSITGLADSNNGNLLIASHIKPWSLSNNRERLDPMNGLLLIPNLDRAFDRGYISFDDELNIIISKKLKDANILGIRTTLNLRTEKIQERHIEYINFHRSNIFL